MLISVIANNSSDTPYQTSIQAPIGIFDSGIGGISILREIQQQLPHENLIYLADQANVPYGLRSLQEVQDLSFAIVTFLLDQGAKLICVACNTASAASLHTLRQHFPQVPFVGMEPAVKPAAQNSSTGTVGVLATPATFQGELFASVVERFAEGVTILQETLPGLVEQIEAGELKSSKTRSILERGVIPLLDQGADTIVLACTHFPLIIPLLLEIVEDKAQVIDPSPAIARQVNRLLDEHRLGNPNPQMGSLRILTTADPQALKVVLDQLSLSDLPINVARWSGGKLISDTR